MRIFGNQDENPYKNANVKSKLQTFSWVVSCIFVMTLTQVSSNATAFQINPTSSFAQPFRSNSMPLHHDCNGYRSTGSHQQMTMSNSMSTVKPKGCASKPYQKKKVAVFGAGGYVGSTIFGFLQRASSIYGTGLGGPSSPRGICATAAGSMALNSVLSKHFKLAYASEYMVTLTNMLEENYIANNLKGMDAAILATCYDTEVRPVTGNTYETNPNSKTNEFYFGGRKRGGDMDNQNGFVKESFMEKENREWQLTVFRNSIKACVKAGLKHVVVIQTIPKGMDCKAFAEILDEVDIPFTYICFPNGASLNRVMDYTFERGIQGSINMETFTLSKTYKNSNDYTNGDWMVSFLEENNLSGNVPTIPTAKEDVAALAVQSLMSLDWNEKRIIEMGTTGTLLDDENLVVDEPRMGMNNPPKSDSYWCKNSELLELKLTSVQ